MGLSHSRAGASKIERELARFTPVPTPWLVMLCGLPGVGKSVVARCLQARLRAAVVSSDEIRLALFPQPTYAAPEHARVFAVCHAVIEGLLRRRLPLIMDATNLAQTHRRRVYAIADRQGAPVFPVWVSAPEEVVRARLSRRDGDPVLAGWDVYRAMRETVEPLPGHHFAIDTDGDIGPALNRITDAVAGTVAHLSAARDA